MLIGQNVWHMQYADLPVSFLTVSFRAAVLPCSQLTGRAITLSARQISLVQQMLNAHNAESYAYDCVESLLKLLLADMLRNTDKQLPVCSAQRLPATSHAEQRIVDKLIQIVSARAGEKLSLQALADEAHISTTYLHRLFRSQLGMTPGTYIAKSAQRKVNSSCAVERCLWARLQKTWLFEPAALFPPVQDCYRYDAVGVCAQSALTGLNNKQSDYSLCWILSVKYFVGSLSIFILPKKKNRSIPMG